MDELLITEDDLVVRKLKKGVYNIEYREDPQLASYGAGEADLGGEIVYVIINLVTLTEVTIGTDEHNLVTKVIKKHVEQQS